MRNKGRIAELDGLRGVAVILVVIHHYFTGIMPADVPWLAKVVHDLTAPFFLSGVDLFFVISGFIVGGLVIDNVSAHGFFRSFYIRRATRILPLYFGMYGLFLIAVLINSIYPNPMGIWLLKDNMPLWSYVVFAQNYFMAVEGHAGGKFFAMAWSVATEEHFYLLFPPLLWYIGLRRSAVVCCCLLIACPLIRELATAQWGFFAAYVPFPARADSIAYGVLVAIAVRAYPALLVGRPFQSVSILVAGLSGGTLIAYSMALTSLGNGSYFSLLALFYSAVIVVGVIGHGWLARVLRANWLQFFGAISYALYMFHQAVNGSMFGFLRHSAPSMISIADFVLTCASAVIATGLAYASTRWMEMPVRRAGYRVTRDLHVEPATSWNSDVSSAAAVTGRA